MGRSPRLHPVLRAPAQASPGVPAPSGNGQSLPPLPPDVQWSCKPMTLTPNGTEGGPLTEPLTVGQKFILSCEGPSSKLVPNQARLELPKQLKYAIKILDKSSLGDTSAHFVATTYVVGNLDFKNPILTDGATRLGLGDFSLKSSSVITKENNPENKPYGPVGPSALAWPVGIWIALAVLIAAVVFIAGYFIRRRFERRRLLANLDKHGTSLTPYNQFNKDLRKLHRQLPSAKGWSLAESTRYFTDLDQSFRWYIARELVISALDTSPRKVLSEVKRVDPELYKLIRKNLYYTLTEVTKAKEPGPAPSSGAVILGDDAVQLTEIARKLADQVNLRATLKEKK